MWVGTEGGAIYSLSLPEFEPNNDATIHQDQVMQRFVTFSFCRDIGKLCKSNSVTA